MRVKVVVSSSSRVEIVALIVDCRCGEEKVAAKRGSLVVMTKRKGEEEQREMLARTF